MLGATVQTQMTEHRSRARSPKVTRSSQMTRAALLFTGLLLVGCVNGRNSGDLMVSCMFETDAPGSYTAAANVLGANGLPVVVPAKGGTASGAAAISVCMDRRASAEKVAIRNATTTTTAPGEQALPTDYPLMPGDAELWAGLSAAQRQLALSYLQSGGTIRSSLAEK